MLARLFTLVVFLASVLAALAPGGAPRASAESGPDPAPRGAASASPRGPDPRIDAAGADAPAPSHRLIVELESPPLAAWAYAWDRDSARSAGLYDAAGRLDPGSAPARAWLDRLAGEQAGFLKLLARELPELRLASYLDAEGRAQLHRYGITFNGLTLDAGAAADRERLRAELLRLPGARAVYADLAQRPDMYASLPLIQAPAVWGHPAIGGAGQAGAGIRVASMDGGVHKDAPMFDGAGFRFPAGYPKGYRDNTNGKIIASRAYFRPFDPPAPGDEMPWPGENGTSHGVHTASTAAGSAVSGSYWGAPVQLSGVAPRAWVLSYRVFYASVLNDGSFHNAEGIACLEDVVRDGADVLNNSWGGGPASSGGEHDALDRALINASSAGIFVSMSAGNAGPGKGTTDHPSTDYITVAATTTSGGYASGKLRAVSPEPVPPALEGIGYSVPDWGAILPVGRNRLAYRPAAAVDPQNADGCDPWPAGSFDDRAALVVRGGCEFGLKAYLAEQAGATFAIVYNHAVGGEELVNMGGGVFGSRVTIPAIFVGHSHGQGLVDWSEQHGDAAAIELDTLGYFVGNEPDRVADFSSRGPGAGGVLKPDVAAPGVNIMAQGYDETVRGEARHLGFGQAGGTSMAAPHVAGAAALLRQIHPSWDNATIKAALMGTARYLNVYNSDGSPAQPLDIGAGRIDLAAAVNPGLVLDPPSLSFGELMTGTHKTITVKLRSVARDIEMYSLSSVYTGAGFTRTLPVAGLGVNWRGVTLAPGETKTIEVTWHSDRAYGYGDNQGYLLLRGIRHEVHAPVWMRVTPPRAEADTLVIDNDGSALPEEILGVAAPGLRLADYGGVYTRTLAQLGYRAELLDADALADPEGEALTILPDATTLGRYRTLVYQTGDNPFADANLPGSSAPTIRDMNRLTEYANAGGRVAAFGQDLAAVFGSASADTATFFYETVLGAQWLRDSVTGGQVFTQTNQVLTGVAGSPFARLALDLSARSDGAANQGWVDELRPEIGSEAIFRFSAPGASFAGDGDVALAHRDQPSLERPGVTFRGRALYFAFGLEGVGEGTGFNGRAELLGRAMDWLQDEATVVISPTVAAAPQVSTFAVDLRSTHGGPGTRFRIDFGDGSAYAGPTQHRLFGHSYARPGVYIVRVEGANALGTRALAATEIYVPGPDRPGPAAGRVFLPLARQDAGGG